MKVSVLFFEGCPNHQATAELVRDVAQSLGVNAEILQVEVKGLEEARQLRFLGSPTVQVEGEDIEAERRDHTDYAMSCRIYGTSGIPPREMVVSALTIGMAHER
jgi:hypothetical protein